MNEFSGFDRGKLRLGYFVWTFQVLFSIMHEKCFLFPITSDPQKMYIHNIAKGNKTKSMEMHSRGEIISSFSFFDPNNDAFLKFRQVKNVPVQGLIDAKMLHGISSNRAKFHNPGMELANDRN